MPLRDELTDSKTETTAPPRCPDLARIAPEFHALLRCECPCCCGTGPSCIVEVLEAVVDAADTPPTH